MKMLNVVARVSSWTRGKLGIVASLGVLLMVASIVPDVLGRYLFNQPILGVLEFNQLLIIAVVFLPLARNQANRVNVRVNVLVSKMPAKWPAAAALLAWLLGFLFYVWMAESATKYAYESIVRGEFTMGLIEFPLWPSKVALALGTWLLSVQLLVDIVNEVKMLRFNRIQTSGFDTEISRLVD